MTEDVREAGVPTTDDLRSFARRPFLAMLWLMVPAAAVTASVNGNPWVAPTVATGVMALLAQLMCLWSGVGSALTRQVLAVAAVVGVSSLVLAAAGPWQIDFHMIYFAVLATMVPFCDWRMILTAAAVTAVHHLSFAFFLPWAVFPDGGDIYRVLFHAVVVVLEVAALLLINDRLVALLDRARDAVIESQAQRREIQDLMAREQTRSAANEDQKRSLMQEVARDLEGTVGSVVEQMGAAVQRLNGDAGSLSRAMETTGGAVRNFAAGADAARDQAAAVADAATALREAIASVSAKATDSSAQARRSAEQAASARGELTELQQSIEGVGDVVRSIGEIAAQTNLLALNATIESARAGEAGQGFAVVANEVKTLADQSQQLTDRVFNQIAEVKAKAERAIASAVLTTEAVEAIDRVLEEINETAVGNARQTDTVLEGIREVSRETERVSGEIVGAEKAIGDAENVAGSVVSASEGIAAGTRKLRDALATFLSRVGSESGENRAMDRAA